MWFLWNTIILESEPQYYAFSHRQYLAQRVKPFVLQNEVLYKFKQDNRFRHVLQPK
jgi:hypothetical protein